MYWVSCQPSLTLFARANDQKAFYWLLHSYRDKQLEDFKPELARSTSDYHHLKPAAWKKRVSTCQFSQPRANGHGRSVSRFTVISNAAETEADTVQSYDPYRGSRILKPCNSQVSHAKITVHRDVQSASENYASQATRMRSGSNTRRGRASSARASFNGRPPSSRGSMTSLRSSRQGTPHAHGPGLRHKRGVDFTHIRKRSGSAHQAQVVSRQSAQATVVTISSVKQQPEGRQQSPDLPRLADGTHPKAKGAPKFRVASTDASELFHDELRHFSSNIAKDCDEAFRSSLIEDDSVSGSLADGEKPSRNTPFSFNFEGTPEVGTAAQISARPWETRPLPPLPSDGASSKNVQATSKLDSGRQSSRDSALDSADHSRYQADALAKLTLLPMPVDRRVVSAPAYTQGNKKTATLPSINENPGAIGAQNDTTRIVSAPPRTPTKKDGPRNRSVDYLSQAENTIRVVYSPTAPGPVKVPEPLNLRKKAGSEDFGRVGNASRDPGREAAAEDPRDMTKKRKLSWFKRGSRSEEDGATPDEPQGRKLSEISSRSKRSNSTSSDGGKKINFNFPFWKNTKESETKMTIAGML